MQEQGARSRAGSVAFIVLAHVLFVLALVHYASPRPDNTSTPVDYIAFAFIVAPEKPVRHHQLPSRPCGHPASPHRVRRRRRLSR